MKILVFLLIMLAACGFSACSFSPQSSPASDAAPEATTTATSQPSPQLTSQVALALRVPAKTLPPSPPESSPIPVGCALPEPSPLLPEDFDAATRDALALKLHGADADESANAFREFWRKAELQRAAKWEAEAPARAEAAELKAAEDAAAAELEAARRAEAEKFAAAEKADMEAGLDADGNVDLTRMRDDALARYAEKFSGDDAEARRVEQEFLRREREAAEAESGEDLRALLASEKWRVPTMNETLGNESMRGLWENAEPRDRMKFFKKPEDASRGARDFEALREKLVQRGFTQYDTHGGDDALLQDLRRVFAGEKVMPEFSGRVDFAEAADVSRADAEARRVVDGVNETEGVAQSSWGKAVSGSMYSKAAYVGKDGMVQTVRMRVADHAKTSERFWGGGDSVTVQSMSAEDVLPAMKNFAEKAKSRAVTLEEANARLAESADVRGEAAAQRALDYFKQGDWKGRIPGGLKSAIKENNKAIDKLRKRAARGEDVDAAIREAEAKKQGFDAEVYERLYKLSGAERAKQEAMRFRWTRDSLHEALRRAAESPTYANFAEGENLNAKRNTLNADVDAAFAEIRKAFPELARQYDVRVGEVEAELRAAGYRGEVPEAALGARLQAERELIVIAAEAWQNRKQGAGVLMHEAAHVYLDTLPAETHEQLKKLWKTEIENKTGALYEDGQLRSELQHVEEQSERGFREWFSERTARINEQWAADKLDGKEPALLRKMAFQIREAVMRVWRALARKENPDTRFDADVFEKNFREFVSKGKKEAERAKMLKEADVRAREKFLRERGDEEIRIVKSPDRVPSLKDKEVWKWAAENLQGKELPNDDFNRSFAVTRDGLGKMIKMGSKPFHRERLAAIYQLSELVKYAKGVEMPDGGGNQKVSSAFHLYVPWEWQGKIYRIRLLAREFYDGKSDIHSYRIEDIIFENKKEPSVHPVNPDGNRGNPSHNGSEGSLNIKVAELFAEGKQQIDFAEQTPIDAARARANEIEARIQKLNTEADKFAELENQGALSPEDAARAREVVKERAKLNRELMQASKQIDYLKSGGGGMFEAETAPRRAALNAESDAAETAWRVLDSHGRWEPDALDLEEFGSEWLTRYADTIRSVAKKVQDWKTRTRLLDISDVARRIRDERAARGALPEVKWKESAKDFGAPIDERPMSLIEQAAAMAESENAARAEAEAAALLAGEEAGENLNAKRDTPNAPEDLPAVQDVPDDFTPTPEAREYEIRKDVGTRAASLEGSTKLPDKPFAKVGEWAGEFIKGFRGALPDLPFAGEGARTYGRVKEGFLELRRGMERVLHDASEDVENALQPILALKNPLHADDYARAGKVQAEVARLEEKIADAGVPATERQAAKLAELRGQLKATQAKLENDAYYVFQNFLLYRDLLVRSETLTKDNGDPITLPFNLNPAEVKERANFWADKVKAHADKSAILQSVARYENLITKSWDDMRKRGVLTEGMWNGGKYYFPHVVLDKWSGAASRYDMNTAEQFREYLKTPVGSAKAIETDFIKAVWYHMAAVRADNLHQDTVKNFFKPYDISEKLKAEARFLSRENEAPVSWRSLVNTKTHDFYTPSDELSFHAGVSIDRATLAKAVGKIIGDGPIHEELKKLGLGDVKLPPEVFHEALLAGEKEVWVLPKPVAAALRDMRNQAEWQPGRIEKLLTAPQQFWKKWMLFAPHNWIRYEFNNTVADSQRMFTSSPEMALKFKEAAKEVRAFLSGKDEAAITPEVREAFKLGVFDSPTETEVNALRKMPEFDKLAASKGVLDYLGDWSKAGITGSRYREATYRYALYKTNLEKYQKGATPSYGGAYWRDIEAMTDSAPGAGDAMRRKAAAISLASLNDFSATSRSGAVLRRWLIPFYNFQEANFKYHINLFRNMRDMATLGGEGGRAAGWKAALTAGSSFGRQAAVGLALRMVMPLVCMQIFNTFFPGNEDLEEQLSEEDRRRPHLLLGKDGEGKARVIYLNNDLGEVMRWFGGNRAAANIADVLAGRTDFATAADDWARNGWRDVLNTAASVGPIVRVGYTAAARKNLFPDVTDQRSIPGSELKWAILSQMTDMTVSGVARWALDGDYYSPKDLGDWAQQAVLQIRKRDPEQWAYYAIRDKAAQFLEDKTGRTVERGTYDAPEAQVLRNFRRAIYKGDVENAVRFYNRLLQFGYTAERLKASIKSQDPLGDLPKLDGTRRAFVESLSEPEREQLQRAMVFYRRMAALRGNERGLFPHEFKGNAPATTRAIERFRANPREQLLRDAMAERLRMDAAEEEATQAAEAEIRRSLRKR